MAWQEITTSNSEQAHYRDLLAQIVQLATSKRIATISSIAAAGSGYVVGDVLTYSHASGTHDATFEVTAIGGSGDVTELRIVNSGAFGRRVATIAVGASGGTGYAVGDIVEIDESHVAGTDFRQRCKAVVDTLSGSAVATLSIFEGGGNYDGGTDPSASDSTTTAIGGTTGAGSGLVVDVTMQAITGTSSLSLTGGTGTGCQVNVTLANAGWVALRDDHDYTTPHGETDEKQVVLQGTVSGGDAPLIGYVTWFDESGVDDFWGLLLVAMDTYNDGLDLDAQVGANPNSDVPSTSAGSYVPSFNQAETSWLSMDGRRISGCHKTVGTSVNAYHHHYLGLFDPFGTATESPYPMVMAGSISGTRVWDVGATDAIDVTGLGEAFRNSDRQGPIFYRRVADGTWLGVHNANDNSFSGGLATTLDRCVFPIGAPRQGTGSELDLIEGDGDFSFHNGIGKNNGLSPSLLLKPAPGSDAHDLLPLVVELRASKTAPIEFGPAGRFANAFWINGTKADGNPIATEDTARDPDDDTILYRVFQTGVRTEPYSFIAMQEA